jgi:hypothetical protein
MLLLLTFQIILLVYHQIITWLDFFPFNNPQQYKLSERTVESLLHGIPFALSAIAVVKDWENIQNVTFMFYFAILGVGIMTWWIPYLAGPGRRWKEQYSKMFSSQIKFLPNPKRPVTPTLEVTIQHLLLLIVMGLFVQFRLG